MVERISNGVEVCDYTGEGYMPVVDYGAWRVALMHECEGCRPENLDKLERHNETDEVFVLLEGACTLILSDEDTPTTVVGVRLKPGKVYNVKRGVWHTHAFYPNTSVLIVENRDTGSANSVKVPLPHPIDWATLPYPLEDGE